MLAQEYPVTVACEVLGCVRSSYYYHPTESPDEIELSLQDPVRKGSDQEGSCQMGTYGYRRITAQLRRQEWLVTHKRVQRLMRLVGIQAKIKPRKRRTTNREHDFPRYPNLVQELEIVRPEQVWVSDITYIRLCYDLVYLAVIMHVFTRGIRGWHLGRSLDYTLTLTALQRALARYPTPEIHHSDQGVQYAATAYTQVLQDVNVQISMADEGEAWQNGYAERLIRTIKQEEVDLSECINYNDAYRQIGRFLDDMYMHKRIHSSLGYLSPAEFEDQWRREHALALSVN